MKYVLMNKLTYSLAFIVIKHWIFHKKILKINNKWLLVSLSYRKQQPSAFRLQSTMQFLV